MPGRESGVVQRAAAGTTNGERPRSHSPSSSFGSTCPGVTRPRRTTDRLLLVVRARPAVAVPVGARRRPVARGVGTELLLELGMSRARQDAPALALLLEPVGEELPVQRRGVDAQDLAGPLLLPLGVIEHLEDVLLLEFLEAHRRRLDDQAPPRRRAEADLLGQVVDVDRAFLV